MRYWLLLIPLLAACGALKPGHATYASTAQEVAALRHQRADIEARLRAAQFRRDTQRQQNAAFPDSYEGEISQLESQHADLEQRLRALEREGGGDGPTSVEQAP